MSAFTLAATNSKDIGGVICSFDSKWQDAIECGKVEVVFRKKRLAGQPPPWLYVYLGAPVSSITARMPILSAQLMKASDALNLSASGAISSDALERYIGTTDSLFVLKVGDVEIAKKPLLNSDLAREYRFFPSPNFIRLSACGAKTLDKKAQFMRAE